MKSARTAQNRVIAFFRAGTMPTNRHPSRMSDRRIVIVETKGQEDLDVPLKMARLRQWCEDINRVQKDVAYDFVYVDEKSFEKYKPTSFRQLLEGFKEYKGKK
jgi:type III restriction enzyme